MRWCGLKVLASQWESQHKGFSWLARKVSQPRNFSQQQGGKVSGFHQLADETLLGSCQKVRREIGLVLKKLHACYIHFFSCHEYTERLYCSLKCIYVTELLLFLCCTKVVLKITLK
jgi:hypothetical protein